MHVRAVVLSVALLTGGLWRRLCRRRPPIPPGRRRGRRPCPRRRHDRRATAGRGLGASELHRRSESAQRELRDTRSRRAHRALRRRLLRAMPSHPAHAALPLLRHGVLRRRGGRGPTEEAQLACAVGSDRSIHELDVTVDGATTALVNPRFELFSPQRTVQLPEDNVFGVSEVSFTAHGWGAVVRRLRPGVHTVTMELVAPDWGEPTTFTVVVDVLRSGVR